MASRRTNFSEKSENILQKKGRGSTPPVFLGGLLCLYSFLLYSITLYGSFIFDDHEAIETNQDIRPETSWIKIFTNDFWGMSLSHPDSHKSYRPLTIITFRINYMLHGLSPFGYHFVNVCLHSIVCLLLLVVLWVMIKDIKLISMTTFLFAAHPIHTEAVANIVGRAELLSAIFFLLSLVCYIKCTRRSSSWLLLIMCLLMAIMGTLCKEQAVTVLGVCLIYEMFIVNSHLGKSTRKYSLNWKRVIILSVSILCIITARLLISQGSPVFVSSDNPASFSNSQLTRFLTYTHLSSLNFWLLLAPSRLCFDWSMGSIPLMESLSDVRNFGTILFFIFLAAVTCKLLATSLIFQSKERLNNSLIYPMTSCLWSNDSIILMMGYIVMLLPFLPASNFFFPVGFVLAERVLYIPSIGFCLLVAFGLEKINTQLVKLKRIPNYFVPSLFYLLLFVFSIKTVVRCWEWRHTESLVLADINTNPENAKIHFTMGNVLAQQGNRTCETYYRAAIKLKPDYTLAWTNLGLVLLNTGRPQEAEDCYKTAISIKPDHLNANTNMGHLCRLQGRWKEALTHYNVLIKRIPDSPVGHYYVGWMLLELKEKEKSEKELNIALSLHQTYSDAHILMGRLLASNDAWQGMSTSVKRLKKAIKHYRHGLSLKSSQTSKEDYLLFGRALIQTGGGSQEAEQYLRLALEIDPNYKEAQKELQLLLKMPSNVH